MVNAEIMILTKDWRDPRQPRHIKIRGDLERSPRMDKFTRAHAYLQGGGR